MGATRVQHATTHIDELLSVNVVAVGGEVCTENLDQLAVEEPLAIRIAFGPIRERQLATISITMRTPGHDAELAAGFLFVEGVLTHPDQIVGIHSSRSTNCVQVDLHPDLEVDLTRLDRRGYTTSSCGVCGKTSIEAIEANCDGPRAGGKPIPPSLVHSLPARLHAAQPTFSRTGGLHAAALFDHSGSLLGVFEDVGRHNAVDKLVGAEFRAGRLPLDDHILLVSGRAGFELVQKSAIAGVPIFAAVGAPTSLAVELARRLGVTLLGFVRDGRFNIYAGPERIAL
ncbi:MAG: formate dehydrogenase accessory sulfurtransferase FdhD [Gemmataceae bacterium]|nr:formate dehydrogenase accessory sulfurtransferase FdhD [Gemmataceae bacterium]